LDTADGFGKKHKEKVIPSRVVTPEEKRTKEWKHPKGGKEGRSTLKKKAASSQLKKERKELSVWMKRKKKVGPTKRMGRCAEKKPASFSHHRERSLCD